MRSAVPHEILDDLVVRNVGCVQCWLRTIFVVHKLGCAALVRSQRSSSAESAGTSSTTSSAPQGLLDNQDYAQRCLRSFLFAHKLSCAHWLCFYVTTGFRLQSRWTSSRRGRQLFKSFSTIRLCAILVAHDLGCARTWLRTRLLRFT